MAEPFLRAEGFTDVQYSEPIVGRVGGDRLADGEFDIMAWFAAPQIIRVDAGSPIVFLGGLHVGCFELIGTDRVRAIRDLKGKSVGIGAFGGVEHVFLSSMAAYVGLDPRTEIDFVVLPSAESVRRLEEGTIDAVISFPPLPQELRARQVGHVVVNSTVDKPWSQYFCCMLVANKEFAQKNPVVMKRAMRAFLKTADLCDADPDRAAQYVVDKGFAPRLDYARQSLREISYKSWREYDPEDAIRFFALRLQEVGMIRSSPEQIISKGTNWKFFNELKQELKS